MTGMDAGRNGPFPYAVDWIIGLGIQLTDPNETFG
jgi:hypothetical protein